MKLSPSWGVWQLLIAAAALASSPARGQQSTPSAEPLQLPQRIWSELPPIPDELGLAGPVVGVHREVLLVGGGANFPRPVWETQKRWLSALYGLRRVDRTGEYAWRPLGELPSELAYAACATTSQGVVIAGGNDSEQVFHRCWLAQVDSKREGVDFRELPKLPKPCVYGQACAIDDVVYLAGGQSGSELMSAMSNFWQLDLSKLSNDAPLEWVELAAPPWQARAFNITVAAGQAGATKLFVLGGRRATRDELAGNEVVEFLRDCWEFDPRTDRWKKLADLPSPNTAGTAIGLKDASLLVLSGDDGALFARTDELKDKHPGFPRKFYLYNADSDQWSEGVSPANQVTTLATWFEDQIVIPSGEVRPRVRTPRVWSVRVP